MKLTRILAGSAAALIAATGLVACNDSAEEDSAAGADTSFDGPIRIGTTDANLREWDVFQDLAEEEGIDVEIVTFADYNTPNDALAQDQLDVNKFQHLQFLSS